MSEITITGATIEGVFANVDTIGFRIRWIGEDGWGQISIKSDDDGVIRIDSEYLSKDTVKLILSALVDNAELLNG